MDLGLRDRVALVAGATRGIGLAVANALAGEGATVAFCGRSRQRAAERAKPHAGAIGVELDLNDEDAARAAVAEVRDRLGPIDILVLNGGGPPAGTALGVDVSRARQAADLLLYGHLRLVSECVATMRERGWGRIVAVGSSAVHQPIDTLATSSMFRAGLGSYLKLLAGEVAADGVTVNMVLPGRIATDRLAELDQGKADRQGRPVEDVRAESRAAIPAGRYGAVAEFAAVVAFLCGAPASYVTGTQLRVDGGLVRAL